MRPYVDHEEVEALLTADARARLPLARQLLVYLNPFALFKDASCGPAWMRERARSYNRAMRWVLLPYLRRWTAIAVACFAGIAPAEALAGEASVFLIPAATSAVGGCVAVTVAACTLAAYLLLGFRSREPRG
jgi:hypothetical protein